jgi:hypothetical protein
MLSGSEPESIDVSDILNACISAGKRRKPGQAILNA